ncbi:MAG: PstS family phosphate ABC transporter substrate-binding protein [Cyanobacteria bacterium Co-bin13]|nr:PstS family phosphate ABC transporter substrate-binding protein [Cyanobacteria bacterium Co-bin13]
MTLSTTERLHLIRTLNKLPKSLFSEILFAINPPSGTVSGSAAPQAIRTAELLEWVESPVGPGLPALKAVLEHYQVESSETVNPTKHPEPPTSSQSNENKATHSATETLKFQTFFSRKRVVFGAVGLSSILVAGGIFATQFVRSEDTHSPVVPSPAEGGEVYQKIQSSLDKPLDPLYAFEKLDENIEKLAADGSVSAVSLMRELQRSFSGFPVIYGVNNTTPQGSNEGIKRLSEGSIQVAISSRPLEEEEQNQKDLRSLPIGKDAIAVVVHKDNPISGLTTDQLRRIYTCRITDWIDVGWTSEKAGEDYLGINVFNRNPSSGTYEVFRQAILSEDEKFCGDNQQQSGSSFVTWQRDETTPVLKELGKFGIYYTSLNHVVDNKSLRILPIDGVSPNAETVLNGEYKLTRDLYVVAKERTYPEVIEFIRFVISPEGQNIVRQYHIPIYNLE